MEVVKKRTTLAWISHPDAIHGSWGLQCMGDPEMVERFRIAMRVADYDLLGLRKPFEQGNQRNWSYFEFLGNSLSHRVQDSILTLGQQIAENLRIGFELDLDRDSLAEVCV